MLSSTFRTLVRAVILYALTSTAAFAQKTINIPADYPTIQAGVNAANTGDTVLVAPGTYYENITISSKEITLKSTGGAQKTILDGGHNGPVIDVFYTLGMATVLDGFTIRNGVSIYGYGSGINLNVSGVTIQNNIFTQNWQIATIAASISSVNVLNNQFDMSSPPGSGSFCNYNGAIYLFGNLQVPLNSTHYAPSLIRGNVIDGKSDPCAGAGVEGLAFDVTVENNIIRNTGSGISLDADKINIRQNLIYGNQSGGIALTDSDVPATEPGQIFVTNNTIFNNLAHPGPDKAPYYGEVVVNNVYARMSLSNNLIVANSSTSPAFACSPFPFAGYGPTLTPVILDHNDIVNINPSPYPFQPMACSDDNASTEIGLNGNISKDPLFVSPSDFHLRSGSPAIDAGNNSAFGLLATDLDGNPRILDSTGFGSPRIDMGAYEITGIATIPPTTVTLTSSSYFIQPLATYTLTATPAASGGAPAGIINIYEDDLLIDTQTVAAGGFTSKVVGGYQPSLHRYTANYVPTGSFAPAISTVIYVRTDLYTPTLRLNSAPNPSLIGQTVIFTVRIAADDTNQLGPIILTDNSNPLATLTPDITGVVTFSTSALTLGSHSIGASYAGDKTHHLAAAQLYQNVVNGYPTSTTLTSSLNPSVTGQSVTFTSTVTSTSATPTGSIQFSDGTTILATQPLSPTGVATFATSALTVGVHTITAAYIPTGSFAGSNFILPQQVLSGYPTTTTLVSSLNPSSVNQAVAFTAQVTSSNGVPTGTVQFFDGAILLATQSLDSQGMATFTSSDLTIGSHNLTARFASAASFAASAGALTQTVEGFPTATTLTAAPTSGPYGTPIQLTATVSGTSAPYGPLHHFYDGTSLANKKIAVFGNSTVHDATDFFLQLATHAQTGDVLDGLVVTPAIYSNPAHDYLLSLGNIVNEGHSGQTLRAMLALGEVDSLCNQGYSLIIFRGGLINDVRLGQTSTAQAQGLLQQALDTLHNGCPNVDILLTTENSLTIQDTNSYAYVQPETAAAVQTYSDELYNAVVPFDHYFPNLIFYDVQQNLYGRTAPFTSPFMLDQLHPAPAGEIAEADLVAAFIGSSRASLAPGGTVAFYTGTTFLGNATLTNGQASYVTTSLPVGLDQVTAVYLGDLYFAPSTSNVVPVTLTVAPTTLTLTSSANPSPALFPLTFTAQLFANTGPVTINGVPVVFTIDGKIAATVITANQGVATLTISTLAPGTHIITASFVGDLISQPSASVPLTEQIVPDATVTTVLPPMGTITQLDRVSPLAVVRSNYLSAIPTGSVTIFEGTTALATATLTPTTSLLSNASILLNPLPPGTHILVAVYTPDTISFLPSQSAPFTLIVVPATFTLTLSDPTLTLQTGHHHADTISLTSIGGLGGAFTLSCGTPLPTYTTCTWAQTSVILPASGTVSTSFTIDTDQLIGFLAQNQADKPGAPFVARTLRHGWAATTLATLIPFALFGLGRRNKLRPLLSLLLLAALATTLTACGADKYPASTAPGTYIIPIKAIGPAIPGGVTPTKTVNLTLVVTP